MRRRIVAAFCVAVLIGSVCTGCSQTSEIENTKLVTACYAQCTNDDVTYKFYVSVPGSEGGESEEGKSASKGKIFEFKAKNFSQALSSFRNSTSDIIDTGHVSLFAAHPQYLDLKFKSDQEYIRKEIRTTPVMYYCVSQDADALFEFISSECDGNPGMFSEDMFEKRNNYLACTATELHFAFKNKYYTAAVPVVDISSGSSSPVAKHSGVYACSDVSGTFFVSENDFEIYKICRKKLYGSKKFYDINILDGKMQININKKIEKSKEITEFANKYSSLGFDLLNCIYFSKKKFPTYDSYKAYVDNLSVLNLNFVCGGK